MSEVVFSKSVQNRNLAIVYLGVVLIIRYPHVLVENSSYIRLEIWHKKMIHGEKRAKTEGSIPGGWGLGSVLSSNTFKLIFNAALIMYIYVCIGRGIEEGVQKTNVLELSDNSLMNINWFTPLDYRFVLHIQQTILTIITFKCLYNGTCFGRKFRDWQQRGLPEFWFFFYFDNSFLYKNTQIDNA